MKQKNIPFSELYRPRHWAAENLSLPLHRRIGLPQEPEFNRKLLSLFDAYIPQGIDQIKADMLQRPNHYDDQQRTVVDKILRNEPVTVREKNELVLDYIRPSVPKLQTPVTNGTDEDEIVFEDGTTLREAEAAMTFENQNFGDKIII